MAAPRSPSIAFLTLPPLTDPDRVQEVFANDVAIQLRQGAVQLIFSSIQAVESDQDGKTTDHRVIRARVALPIPVSNAMVEACRQLMSAMQQHETVAALATPTKAN